MESYAKRRQRALEIIKASKNDSSIIRMALDELAIGTPHYQGYAYFWNCEYKFTLREANRAMRRKIHNAFLKAGLKLDGESPAHAAIIYRLTGEKYYSDEKEDA